MQFYEKGLDERNMMRKYLVPKFNFGGHFLEYILHIYNYALTDQDNEYIFVLSSSYKGRFEGRHNIKVIIIPDKELSMYSYYDNEYIKDFLGNKLIRRFVRLPILQN